jgi:hypothetical protein
MFGSFSLARVARCSRFDQKCCPATQNTGNRWRALHSRGFSLARYLSEIAHDGEFAGALAVILPS